MPGVPFVIRLMLGDCRASMRTLPAASVQTVITSPPYYGLRDYGLPPLVWGDWTGSLGLEPTPELYIEHLCEVFSEVWRVLRPDGCVFLNLGDSYAGSGKGPSNSISSTAHSPNPHSMGINGGNVPIGYKAKDLMLLPWRVAMALQSEGWWIRSVIPWLKRNCLSGGTRVYVRSQKGDMPMSVKDLARLKPETCKLWNGERWTQLLSMWEVPRGEGDEIEIELRSGERIGCTPDHRWPTERGLLRAYELTVGDVLTGAVLPKPTSQAAQQPGGSYGSLDDGIGWFVGLYLAEGSMSNGTIQIASHTSEVGRYGKLQAIAAAYDGTCRAHLKTGQSMTINLTGPVLRGIIEQYISGRTAKDKHLNNRCWRRSNEFLRNVLDGYLSGDGHWDEQNQRWRLGFTRNYAWEADLRTIAARLNIDLRLKLASGSYAGQDVPIFRGSIRFERSKRLWTKHEREVVRIGRSRGRKFWDIAVEDEPHTFALASGVLTHNSMPESVQDRPATATEYVFLLAKSARYFWDADAVRVTLSPNGTREHIRAQNGGGSPESLAGHDYTREGLGVMRSNPNGRSRRNSDWWFESWQGLLLDEQDEPIALVVNPQPFKESHFATFPPKLVEPMVKAGSRPGDTILDPFAGSGTVGLVADRLDRDAILLDVKPDYGLMSTRRVVQDAPMFVQLEAPFSDGPVMPCETVPDKQAALGKRQYSGFNARWDAAHP